MLPVISRLKALAVDAPTRTRWVIVPSHAIGRMLGDRLALEGTSWANMRTVTPLDLALRMGAPFLVERGIDPSEEGLGPALMMRLLLDLPESASYFRPLADQPPMAMALWATLGELRLAGIRPQDFARVPFTSAGKQAELSQLLAAYEAYLQRTGRGDRATILEEALAHPDWCPVQPGDRIIEWPARWTPLERRLLDALPGERIAAGMTRPVGIDVPRRFDAPLADAAPVAASIAFFQAGGAEAEVEEVLRRILADGRPIDQVEIACASAGAAPLLWEKALRHEWPVTLAMGLPAALTRPGRALLGFAEWVEDQFSSGLLRRLLESGDLHVGDETLTSGRAARLLVRARAAWGRETYRLALGRLAASSRRRAARDDLDELARERLRGRADEAERLGRWITDLIAAVPVPDAAARVPLQAVVSAAAAFVDRHAARASALDHLAAARITAALGELRALGDEHCTLEQALRFVRERVDGLSVGADRARPGHLFVSHVREVGLSGRPVVFVVGLEEGRVFPAAFEDPVLLDEERAGLDERLPLSSDVVDEAVFGVMSRLVDLAATPGTSLTLSCSCRDLRQFRESHPSWVLLYMYRLREGDPAGSYRDLARELGEAVSCVPAAPAVAPAMGRWWLHAVTRGDADHGRRAALEAYPPLAAGLEAGQARASTAFTAFDGDVPAAGRALDPCADGVVVSPTQLEEAAGCPFRYFLRRGLGVEAIETGERDYDVWLDPLTRGSLLHDLYAALLRRCRAEKRAVDVARDGAWMSAEGARVLDALAIEMPPPSTDVDARERQAFMDDLALFVEGEAAGAGTGTPVGCEVGFGRGAQDDAEPLSSASPVTLSIGTLTLRVAGRVDRIDRLADGTFEIIDYKTGRYWDQGWAGTFAGGRRLQHALYGLAAAELLRVIADAPVVRGAQYYFTSTKGRLNRKSIPSQPPGAVAAVLADIRAVIRDGAFVHSPEKDDCRFCDYGAACRAGAPEQAAVKRDDPRLASYWRLAAHE